MSANSCRKKLGKSNGNFSCATCQQCFDSFSKLKKHQILHDRWVSPSFKSLEKQCPLCFKIFSRKYEMLSHYNMVHAKKRDFKCPTCGKEFGKKSNLVRHIEQMHNLVRPYICPDCGASFGLAHHLTRHREAIHLGIRYKCGWDNCTYAANDKCNLKRHKLQVHTNEFKYECLLCFVDEYNWWGCCSPGELDTHMQKKHPKEWKEKQEKFKEDHPHVCKYSKCLKRFQTNVEKERHETK